MIVARKTVGGVTVLHTDIHTEIHTDVRTTEDIMHNRKPRLTDGHPTDRARAAVALKISGSLTGGVLTSGA